MAEHKMTSLKRAPSETKDVGVLAEDGPENKAFFPLSLFVNNPEIKKLGLADAEIGNEYMLFAKVKVTNVSVNEQEGEEKHESIGLTLLEGEVGSSGGTPAEKLFGKA